MAQTDISLRYPDLPDKIEGFIEPAQQTIAPSKQETAFWNSMIRQLAAASCISPKSTIPMGYSLHFIISATRRDDSGILDTNELYSRFRHFVPDSQRIANVTPDRFKEHLRRWAAFNGTPYVRDADGQPAILHGYTLRDQPLTAGMTGAFVEGLAMGAR